MPSQRIRTTLCTQEPQSNRHSDILEAAGHLEKLPAIKAAQQMIRNLFPNEDPQDVPHSMTQCKAKLKTVHIHIVDYLRGDYGRAGSAKALRKRIKTLGFYPRHLAKSNQLAPLLHYVSQL